MRNPRVTIIIPCRNEAKRIGHCLDSVEANDYPKDCLEVLIVDGMSGDGTRGANSAKLSVGFTPVDVDGGAHRLEGIAWPADRAGAAPVAANLFRWMIEN
jgi:GT2 family glycosyltransferase